MAYSLVVGVGLEVGAVDYVIEVFDLVLVGHLPVRKSIN